LGLALLAIVAVHPLLLHGLGLLLVAGEPIEAPTHLWVRGTEQEPFDASAYRAAAAAWSEQPNLRIVLVQWRPTIFVQSGVQPSFVAMSRRELAKLGVPADVVDVVPGEACDIRESVQLLGDWLEAHPDNRVRALCPLLGSRLLSREIRLRFSPALVSRIGIAWLPDSEFDARDWFRSRRGAKRLLKESLLMCFSLTRTDDATPAANLSLDAIEAGYRATLGTPQP
jgi:hypothetical protein